MPEAEATPQISISSINKHSSPEGKINLFRSLFKGREDVFARRWYSKATDKSGYQPVCKNEWNEEFCDKKKFKCSACPNRKLMVLTDKDIYRHLSGKDSYGRDVVGIYPMLTDETCLFLCADFDEENFLICVDNNICAWLKLNGLLNADTAWISMLVVADKYKHQGVGKFAVEYAFEYLQSKGFNQIGVQTTEDNVAAKNLYMKSGFGIAELKEFKTEDGTKIKAYVMLKTLESKKYSLVLPDETHEEAYIQMMDKWEEIEENIQPELLRRYSKSLGANASYSKWLEWCEDDRTTGSMLSTGVPCTLYFFVDDTGEILGAIVINQKNTHRGHLHAGIVPWHRGKGLGAKMLESALEICRNMGMTSVDIVPYKFNKSAIKTILKNGGILMDEFYEDEKWSQRYTISL